MGNLTNTYLYKAIDAFPYDLEETIEALNYALSYDDKNTMALSLMGRGYAEKLADYDKAISCFREALEANVNAIEVYAPYIDVLLWNEDFAEAKKLVKFALTVKGADKGVLYVKKALVFEYQKQYKKALKSLKKAEEHTFNSDFLFTIKTEKERIEGKIPKVKKSSKKKQKSKFKKKGKK